MEFLSSLQLDVKLLLVGGALALLAGLVSGTKKNEHKYMAVFTVLMVIAGVRFHQHGAQDDAERAASTDAAVNHMKSGSVRAAAAR